MDEGHSEIYKAHRRALDEMPAHDPGVGPYVEIALMVLFVAVMF
ncbi:hypothetical protein [Methylorubrum extorquens]|nr:hypothetical protein [Methylorubrum extorquens]